MVIYDQLGSIRCVSRLLCAICQLQVAMICQCLRFGATLFIWPHNRDTGRLNDMLRLLAYWHQWAEDASAVLYQQDIVSRCCLQLCSACIM